MVISTAHKLRYPQIRATLRNLRTAFRGLSSFFILFLILRSPALCRILNKIRQFDAKGLTRSLDHFQL